MSTTAAKGEALKVDFNRITIGDMEDFEDITGKPFIQTMEEVTKATATTVPVMILKALVFLVKRLENPDFTLEDARKVRVREIAVDLGGDEDPTDAAG